jgi:hypothetical protein
MIFQILLILFRSGNSARRLPNEIVYGYLKEEENMNNPEKSAIIKEITEYINILSKTGLLVALPENTLVELHRILGASVSLVQHMEEGED